MPITASKLRDNLYRILDEVIATGRPVKIRRKGVILTLQPPGPVSKLANLKKRPGLFVGDPDDIISHRLDERVARGVGRAGMSLVGHFTPPVAARPPLPR
jgi:hypothetical protein